jgi:iron complex outermembrane recepter protein
VAIVVCGIVLNQIQRSAFLAFVLLLTASPAWAEASSADQELEQLEPIAAESQEESIAITNHSQLSEADSATARQTQPPATTVAEWLAQSTVAPIEITGVQLNSAAPGLELSLETTGELAQSATTSVVGNALIINIANATLALPEGNEFQSTSPVEGIALVTVTALRDNQVRITVTGLDAPPTAEIRAESPGLLLSIVPGTQAAATTTDDAIQVVVTGEQDEGYNPSNSSTATGTDTPLRDIPLSIQVIPQEVLEDRNVVELGDALETAGGVVSVGGRGTSAFGPGFLIRGFPVDEGVFRDGIATFSLAPLSTVDLERVEVLRGPSSVLFGQGEPGGIINLVPKRPLSEPFYSASLTAGSFDTYRGALDLSGPLNDSATVRYRLNLAYENYGSFRDFVNGERFIISPILTWDIGANTSLDVYGQYVRNEETIDEGIPAFGDGILDVPRDRFFGEEFGEFEQEQFSLGYRLNHQFSDTLSVRHALQYLQYEPERYGPLFDSFDEDTGELSRLEYFAGGTYRRFFTNAEAIAEFNTGSVEHRVLAGVEYRHAAETPEFQFSNLYEPINVFDPVYTRDPFDIEPEFFRDDNIDTISVYLQDQVELLPNLSLLAGIRYDSASQFRTTQDLGQPREEFEQTDSEFSPRFGIVYQPIEPISLYASYTRSFNPSFGASRNADDSTFDPETGRQFEIGMKADLSEQLSLTLAAFDIRRQNVSNPDPADPNFSIQTGEVASRGIELTLGGEILPGWDITAAYTHLDAFVSEDTRDTEGNDLANVPDNQFSLWTTYEIQRGDLAGLGFGLGFLYLSDRFGDLENTFTLPSFFRTDAAVYYQRDNWRAQLNIENLFDIDYFTSSNFDSRLGVNPGAPLTVLGTISVEF